MPKTPGKIHIYDMVKIDPIVFEIVGGGGAFKAPPRIVNCLKWPGSDRVKCLKIPWSIINVQQCCLLRMPPVGTTQKYTEAILFTQ